MVILRLGALFSSSSGGVGHSSTYWVNTQYKERTTMDIPKLAAAAVVTVAFGVGSQTLMLVAKSAADQAA